MQQLVQRGITLPYTLTFDPASAEYEVRGQFDTDPYDVVEGYGTARTVRIKQTVVTVSFKAGRSPFVQVLGYGFQVRKDGSLGRNVNGVSIYLTEAQTATMLDVARKVVRSAIDAALDSE